MSYYLPWILLLAASLGASFAGLFWALANGQFSDQDRARYLPLRGEVDGRFKAAPPASRGVYGMLAVFVTCGLTLICAFVGILLMGIGR